MRIFTDNDEQMLFDEMFAQQSDDVEYVLTAPQQEYLEATEEYVAVVAGMGSGKTQTTAVSIITKMTEYPTVDFAYLAPTYALIRDIFYPKVSDILSQLGWKYSINKGEHVVRIDGLGLIRCVTMDNPEMIVGWECGDAFLDEFDVLATDKAKVAFQKVSARCRQKFPDGKINQKYVSTTPEGFKATHELFVKKKLPNSRLIQMSTYSNAHNLPNGYIEGLRSQYPPELIEAYLEGKFVNLRSGRVYAHFDRNAHHTSEKIRSGEMLYIGQDFNYGGCVSSICVVRGERVMLLDYIVSKDTRAICENIKARYPGHFVSIYPDSSAGNNSSNSSQTDIQILQAAGFNVVTSGSNPLIRDRVNCVNAAFAHGRLLVNTDVCKLHTEALEQQAYDPKTGMPQKTGGPATIDDFNDSLGYFIYRHMPIVMPGFTNTQY